MMMLEYFELMIGNKTPLFKPALIGLYNYYSSSEV